MTLESGFPESVNLRPEPHLPNEVEYRVLIRHQEILDRTRVLAGSIITQLVACRAVNKDAPPPLVIALANGVHFGVLLNQYMALAGLEHGIDPEFDTMQVSSTGPGIIRTLKPPTVEVKGRDVILAESIARKGIALKIITGMISARNPASTTIACMLVRKKAEQLLVAAPKLPEPTDLYTYRHIQTAPPVTIDHIGFRIDCGHAAGYGLDIPPEGRMRNWPDIYAEFTPGKPHQYELG